MRNDSRRTATVVIERVCVVFGYLGKEIFTLKTQKEADGVHLP